MLTGEKTYPGRYREGDSYLHRFDPRVKLLLLGGLMACLFSTASGWRALLLFVLGVLSIRLFPGGWRDLLRLVWMMRWLLLFTLLLHLFFTPGRTLFGTSWLSLDGLLRGLLVNSQLMLAVLFSLLLAWTTRPERLAWGLTSLLSPLERFKLPVREMGGLLLLVLQFFPIISSEVASVQKRGTHAKRGVEGIKAKISLLAPLVMRLLDRADQLALDLVAGDCSDVTEAVDHGQPFTSFDWISLFAGSCLLALVWLV